MAARFLSRQTVVVATTALAISGFSALFQQRLSQWELAVTSLGQELAGVRRQQVPVAVVAIDDFSLTQAANADLSGDPLLKSLQTWPWPREVYAVLLDRLFGAGARAVAIDLLFDAPSARGPAGDQALASVLRRHQPRTVLAAQVLESRGELAGLALSLPLPGLQAAAGPGAVGLLNGALEPDGSIRRRPGDYATALRAQLGPSVPDSLGRTLMRAGGLPDRAAPPPLPGNWLALLAPYGPPRTITTLPVWSLLEAGAYDQLKRSGRLRGQLVVLGPTAAVMQDLHQTVFSGAEGMPGAEIHATEIANRADGTTLWFRQADPAWPVVLGLIALAVGFGIVRIDKPLVRLLVGASLAVLVAICGWLGVAVLALAAHLFSVAAAIALMAVVSTGDATLQLQWQRRRLRLALSRYLSPAVAAQIASQPADADGLLGGNRAEVVIMMTDIRGFTERTRRMSEAGMARELVGQLNEYFGEVVEALHSHGGTVDKFIGDATLAIFGAPLNRGAEAEARAGLAAALEIQQRLQRLNRRWQQGDREPWQQVIVLNYGAVISGNIGSSTRMDYTVIGDAVNAASRLEGVAKQCGRELVMSASFVALIPDVPVEDLGEFELRGQGLARVYGLMRQ